MLDCNKFAFVPSTAYLSGATTPMTRLFQACDHDNATDMTVKKSPYVCMLPNNLCRYESLVVVSLRFCIIQNDVLPSPIFSLVRKVASLGLWFAPCASCARLSASPMGGGFGWTAKTSTPGENTGESLPTLLLSSQYARLHHGTRPATCENEDSLLHCCW